MILEFEPDVWGFSSMPWTRAMVADVIEQLFGVRISDKAVGDMMRHRMGLTPQRPVRRAFECDPEWGRQWSEEEYPRLRARAKKSGATIHFADEASLRSDYHSGTTWAERGRTPVVGATGERFSINLISAISPEEELRWSEIEGTMTAEKFIAFLQRMIKGRKRPVYLIVDGHPAHQAKAVRQFVEENRERLELHLLPSYSPHLNPDELVWNHLKNHTMGKRGFRVVSGLKRMVHDHMEWLRGAVKIVRSFFEESHCQYASASPREELPLPRDLTNVRLSKTSWSMKSEIIVLLQDNGESIERRFNEVMMRHRLDEENIDSIHNHHWDYWLFPSKTPFRDEYVATRYVTDPALYISNSMIANSLSRYSREISGVIKIDGAWLDVADFGWRLVEEDQSKNADAEARWLEALDRILTENKECICVRAVVHY